MAYRIEVVPEVWAELTRRSAADGISATKLANAILEAGLRSEGGQLPAPVEAHIFHVPPEDSDEWYEVLSRLQFQCDSARKRGRFPAEKVLKHMEAFGISRKDAMSPPQAQVWEREEARRKRAGKFNW